MLMGYAATFDSISEDLGGFREIIRPGAFDATLADKPDVSARIQHAGGLNRPSGAPPTAPCAFPWIKRG
jgi:phage head maturation protease